MDRIGVYKKDEVFLKIDCERGTARELSQYFEFEVPGAKFMPSVRNKYWDGKVRLFNVNTMQIYVGLIQHIQRFAEEREYELTVHDGILDTEDVPVNKLEEFLKEKEFTPRDYQTRAVAHAIRNNRALILSPTASGKSFIIYSLIKYYFAAKKIKKALLIVPTTSLVAQMNSDFASYASKPQIDYTHLMQECQVKFPITVPLSAGKEKNSDFYKFTTEDYKCYAFEGNQFIKLINSDVEYKQAKDITTDDEIDDTWLQEQSGKQIF